MVKVKVIKYIQCIVRYGPGEYENDPGAFLKNLISLIKIKESF